MKFKFGTTIIFNKLYKYPNMKICNNFDGSTYIFGAFFTELP